MLVIFICIIFFNKTLSFNSIFRFLHFHFNNKHPTRTIKFYEQQVFLLNIEDKMVNLSDIVPMQTTNINFNQFTSYKWNSSMGSWIFLGSYPHPKRVWKSMPGCIWQKNLLLDGWQGSSTKLPRNVKIQYFGLHKLFNFLWCF